MSSPHGTFNRSHRALSQSEPEFLQQLKSHLSEMAKSSAQLLNDQCLSSLLKMWDTISRINYFVSSAPMESERPSSTPSTNSLLKRAIAAQPKEASMESFREQIKYEDVLLTEQFPINVTSLMNEENLWACFYNFPELYSDVYSPVVLIRTLKDVPDIVGGVLTRDVISTCLTYLRRNPILGDYVFIKLDLSCKHLGNIEVLQHYKYLVYLDLSSNYLTELTVLSQLLYLQFLSVSFNRLTSVLEYEVPQWFLTEVHYKYNSVTIIRDLSMFWSITVLDLSHNNIKHITGLDNLAYLRRLDLSFNHIQRLENLNYLNLIWLDVSYNNISSFEFSSASGLWTLYHLEYLNLNENNLTSLKLFSGCTRLQELHARNNRLGTLLELAVYVRQMRRLVVLDLRANPICSTPGYREVCVNTFPLLLNLDAEELDPIDQRHLKMDVSPDVNMFASRRLLRLMYIEQLSRARVSPFVKPADTTDVPIVIFVGYEAVGKGTLARRLAKECSSNIELAIQHTTSLFHTFDHYKEVSRSKFDDMLLAGDFLTYTEMDGESYGLSMITFLCHCHPESEGFLTYNSEFSHFFTSKVRYSPKDLRWIILWPVISLAPMLFKPEHRSREEAFVKDGKVKLACMDLTSALMLKLRGRRPYLILTTCLDKAAMRQRQHERKEARNRRLEGKTSIDVPIEKSTLQVLVSGRILVTGILNEILMTLSEEKDLSEFLMDSQCSLMMESAARQAAQDYAKEFDMLQLMCSSSSTLENACYSYKEQNETSLCSLYKESQGGIEYASIQGSKRSNADTRYKPGEKTSIVYHPKSVDLRMSAGNSAKSAKSVTFTSQDMEASRVPTIKDRDESKGVSGMLIEPEESRKTEDEPGVRPQPPRSMSRKFPWTMAGHPPPGRKSSSCSFDDGDFWLTFLVDTGLLQASDPNFEPSEMTFRHETRTDDPEYILKQLAVYRTVAGLTPSLTQTTNIKDDYEDVHRQCPGLFWDTITMDDPDAAFKKAKKIIKAIVESQKNLKPMFDIDFGKMADEFPIIQDTVESVASYIAQQRFFF